MSTWSATAGARLGDRYELEAKVGEGGMGEVWRAKHLALENQVAIKFLSGSLANNDETKKRFLMEAKLTAQLRSRHAVQVFDSGLTEDGQPYLVMELLHGEPLSNRIERKRLSLQETASFMGAAAKALHRAHALGIVHRDFKPDNVFLTKGEEQEVEVKVVDFGIAKLIGSLDEARPSATDFAEITGKALSTLTRTGKLVGTPHYMSPEQVRMSAEVGPAADIWAFGVVAFESLTGECPFDGNSVIELFSKIQLGKARKARSFNPDIPEAFDDWFKVACAVDPSLRFPDAQVAATLLADALGVSLGAPLPASELSNPRIMMPPSSSPDISIVSSTDALSRSASKLTLLNSATDHESAPKKSRTAMWGAMASVLIAIGAIGVIKYNAAHRDAPSHASSEPAQVPAQVHVDALPSATASAIPVAVLPAASTSAASAASAAPEDSANSSANSAKNAGKVHGSHGAHVGHPASSDTPAAAAAPDTSQAPHPTQPAPTATATGPASPFSLPPLGL